MKKRIAIASALIPAALLATEQPTIRTLEIPELKIPVLEVPGLAVPALAVPELKIENLEPKRIEITSIQPEIDRVEKVMSPLRKGVRDIRSLVTPGTDLETLAKWSAIYQDKRYTEYKPAYTELAGGLRVICEVRCPEGEADWKTLKERLAYYRGRGYNGVLVTFDTTEDLLQLMEVTNILKTEGWRIVLAYSGGREDLKEPVFRDPQVLADWMGILAVNAEAIVLGWRRTSTHLMLPDRVFQNFLIRAAREGNPRIGFIGSAYAGETAERLHGINYDIPPNCSAVLVIGNGTALGSRRELVEKSFPELDRKSHLIGLVVGEVPYFDSKNATGQTQLHNDVIKQRIELRLIKQGFASTFTFSGDGSDGAQGNPAITDNLCKPYGGKRDIKAK